MDNSLRISRVATVAVFLGLIRCIAEPFRLQHSKGTAITFATATPFLVGALVAATGLFIMTLLSFWRMNKLVSIMAAITIIAMLIVKWRYLV